MYIAAKIHSDSDSNSGPGRFWECLAWLQQIGKKVAGIPFCKVYLEQGKSDDWTFSRAIQSCTRHRMLAKSLDVCCNWSFALHDPAGQCHQNVSFASQDLLHAEDRRMGCM